MVDTPKADAGEKQRAEPPSSRAWQACQPCRRRKVKCDGKQPCHNCSSRGQACDFPEAKDHASASRFYATSFEARCQQMDMMCQKLETVAAQLSQAADSLSRAQPTLVDSRLNEDLVSAATVLQSLPKSNRTGVHHHEPRSPLPLDSALLSATENSGDILPASSMIEDDDSDSSDSTDLYDKLQNKNEDTLDEEGLADQAASLVTDSYGRFRFIGGTTNKMLIDAAKSMSPGARTSHMQTPGSNNSLLEAGSLQDTEAPQDEGDVELPLFVRGKTWPELPFLPRPEQLSRPPQYVSDLLVGLYFDKLHYTFPVLFKPHFMRSYAKMLRSASNPSQASLDKEFLMVFFAVCACASGLLPTPTGSDRGFPGLEYYEKALLLHYASPGQASLERVQCLGLLAMCTASWNTLTQSWSLAGQAVRSSMDIGLHINSRLMTRGIYKPGSNIHVVDLLSHHIARRIWWSVVCLERTVSICLGRPVAVDEQDCCCELPLDLSDDDLERHCQSMGRIDGRKSNSSQRKAPLTGFLAFARLCKISVKIQQLSSPLRLRQLSSFNVKTTKKYFSRVASLDQALRQWLETLPDSVRFSANAMGQCSGGDSGLVMCVIVFIMHAGSLLNLYRCLAHDPNRADPRRTNDNMEEATAQCISAARSCINAAELVRDLVPPSHYLAICVHCLTLSGVALLRMSKQPPDQQTITDAETCVGFLEDLELRWSGAGRSRAIIEHLLSESLKRTTDAQGGIQNSSGSSETRGEQWSSNQKRTFAEFEDNVGSYMEDTLWRDMPWTDILGGGDTAQLGSWANVS